MMGHLPILFIVLSAGSLFPSSVLGVDIHIPLRRRHGRFARHENSNLTLLSETLHKAEHRYSSTYRSVESNGLVRRWSTEDATLDDDALLSARQNDVPWYAVMVLVERWQLIPQVCIHPSWRARTDSRVRPRYAESRFVHCHDKQCYWVSV